jgi:hypothetical protein
LAAARDAISETLQDWDTRRDWRYTQVVSPDIELSANSATFDLPTAFKKPYVAYLKTSKTPLFYIERANWHRMMPGYSDAGASRWYTLYNDADTGKGDLFPTLGSASTLVVLYYKEITYTDSDDAILDIPKRWEGYILDGARARFTLAKSSTKSDRYFALYEAGVKKAKEDDLRLPDQFLSFQPPDQLMQPHWLNPNSTHEATYGWY